MDWISQNWWVLAIIAVVIVVGINVIRIWARRKKPYQELIEPELRGFGFTLVSSTTPGWFDRGPFPKFEIEVGRPHSKTPIGSGEYDEYRIVRFRDVAGNEQETWARLKFALFRIWKIEWKPRLSEFVGKTTGGSSDA